MIVVDGWLWIWFTEMAIISRFLAMIQTATRLQMGGWEGGEEQTEDYFGCSFEWQDYLNAESAILRRGRPPPQINWLLTMMRIEIFSQMAEQWGCYCASVNYSRDDMIWWAKNQLRLSLLGEVARILYVLEKRINKMGQAGNQRFWGGIRGGTARGVYFPK